MSQDNPYAPPQADLTYEPTTTGTLASTPSSRPFGEGLTWIQEGFALMSKHFGMWVLIALTYFVINIVVAFIPFINMFQGLLGTLFMGGFMLGCRSADDGHGLEIGHLFAGFSEKPAELFLLALIMFVATIILLIPSAIIFFVFGGAEFFMGLSNMDTGSAPPDAFMTSFMLPFLLAMLVYMALSLPLVMAIWFAPALVTLNDVNIIDAMRKSFSGCLKNMLPYLLWGIIMLFVWIIAVIPLGLGMLIAFPLTATSLYCSYKRIFLTQGES